MKRITFIGAISLALMCLGCKPEETHKWNDDWDEHDPTPTPTPVDPQVSKPRYVWIDAAANFDDYANDRSKIKEDCRKIAETGFTDMIVDVRPTTGDVLFKSETAPALKRIDRWKGSTYSWAERTATFDYLEAFIEEGHAAGLKVNAAINTLVGGYQCPYGLGHEGMVFSDETKKSWCTVQNRKEGLTSCLDTDEYGPRFLNPSNEEVQDFIITLCGELASYKDLDGIVLDRCRYDDSGLMSDFSEESRKAFGKMIGQTVSNWPSAVFAPGTESLPSNVSAMQKQWLTFRVKTIHDLVAKIEDRVHSVNPDIRFGVYVGAWYSTYYTSGVNWASSSYNCTQEYPWASSEYKTAGLAELLDFIFLGAYAGADNIHGSTEWTMEGFCKLGAKRLAGAVPYAAGPDIGNPTGFEEGGQEGKIPDIVKTCMNNSDGLFIFDLCHIKMYNYWSAFKSGIDSYLNSIK